MEVSIQIFSNDRMVRNNTVNDLKEFNNQSLATQAKKGEQLVSMMPAIKKAFDLLGDDIVDLFTENDALKNKIGDYDEKWQIILYKWPILVIINFGEVNLMASFPKEKNYKI